MSRSIVLFVGVPEALGEAARDVAADEELRRDSGGSPP